MGTHLDLMGAQWELRLGWEQLSGDSFGALALQGTVSRASGSLRLSSVGLGVGSGGPVDILRVGLEGLISRNILGWSMEQCQEETSWACSLEIFYF